MGCCGSKHPHLDKYFASLDEAANADMKEVQGMLGNMDFDGIMGAGQKMQKKQGERNERLKAHAVNAFKYHDKNGNAVLETDESEVFFQHYVDCYINHFKKSGIAQAKQAGAMAAGMLGAMGGSEMKNMMKQQMNEQVKELTEQANQKVKEYEKNRAEFNKKAFAVVDVNKDGRLQQEEVVNALTPQHPKNVEFHVALGLMTEMEAQMAQAIGNANAGGEVGCAQQ
mmetsp:Transcript_68333/g.142417  ORF Transcript_68333/g.142417 Transcript_68333/m.142417 type:complete len:226 (-) Transcript_68333:29-706(-)|eukprot:CAMPEP_0181311926 /NCGR_PEP_ID=MMETSP1101-20121128/13415_1 /TAXON_ID=46948 /ORGANISM="Rhodomonas abbreviata, Strain Caron Lab Isolate" /LENGTH=225 /DNA_ID=CAMNT_0023418725 /DNA_START=76 /DNA_END=753 /DNA_ORIENTATION=+